MNSKGRKREGDSLGGLSRARCAVLIVLLLFQFAPAGIMSPHLVLAASAQTPIGTLTYQNSTFGINIQYPSSWKEENLDPSTGGIVRFTSPLENANDTYAENLEIHFVDLARGTTLENYTLTLLQSYKTNLDNFTIISLNSSQLAGTTAHSLVFTASYGNFDYKALNKWSIIGSNALIVIYYAEPDRYLTYLPTISSMIDSIHVQPDIFGKPAPSGVYTIPSLGFEVQFPPGWTSIDKGTGNQTIFKEEPLNQNLNGKDRVVLFGAFGGALGVASQFHSSDSDLSCGTPYSASIVRLNGIKALESELLCDDGMLMKRMKFYMVASQGTSIFIGYGASSEPLYQKYLTDFDTLIQGLKLANATDLSNLKQYSNLFKLTAGKSQFEINGTKYDIDFASNSKLSDFQFDRKYGKLIFSTEEKGDSNRNQDETLLQMDLLRPPYLVNVDDKVGNDGNQVLLINDTTTNKTFIDINYASGNHSLTISASEVVPEYPEAISALVCVLGFAVLILVKRTGPYIDNHSSMGS